MADGSHAIGAGAAPVLSIVMPTFRRQQRLPLCLEWVARCRGAEGAEIIVIDQTPVSEWLPIDNRITNRFFRCRAASRIRSEYSGGEKSRRNDRLGRASSLSR